MQQQLLQRQWMQLPLMRPQSLEAQVLQVLQLKWLQPQKMQMMQRQ